MIIALIGRWVLGGLLKVGVSEGLAGKFVASRVFGPLVWVFLAVAAAGIGKLALMLHDQRIEREATMRCEASHLAAALQTENKALKASNSARELRLTIRDAELAQAQRDLASEKEKNDALRQAAPAGGALVFDADDPWVRQASGPARPVDPARGRRPRAAPLPAPGRPGQ